MKGNKNNFKYLNYLFIFISLLATYSFIDYNLEMDKISKLLEETQNLLEGFSSGSLSPVSIYYNSDSESNEEEFGVMEEFKKILKGGDNSKICKFVESWEQQRLQEELQEQNQNFLKGALHIAIKEKCKDLEVFKSLLRAGCDPLELDSSQKTALTVLLEQKEEEEVEQEDQENFNNDEDCTISTLLGEWELRRAATRDSKIFQFIHSRNWKDLYSFLLNSADPVGLLCKPDAKYAGISPIHEIAALNDVMTMKKILKKFKGIDFNAKAIGSGNTPLHEATHMTSVEMVNFLLQNGAKCEVKNAAGKIPAHLGTEKIQVIIEINAMTKSQEEVKQTSTLKLSSKKSADLFVKATKSASSDAVDSADLSREERKLKQIIGFLDQIEKHEFSGDSDRQNIKDQSNNEKRYTRDQSDNEQQYSGGSGEFKGNKIVSNPNPPENVLQREGHSGRTILHRFARRNQSEKILKFLKENDFDEIKCKMMKLFEVIDNSGSTPLHDAASEGSLEAVKIFLFGRKAAKIKNLLMDPSIPAAITGDTPLHAAVSSGNVEIVELLLAVGANKEAVNIEGKKPIDMTRSKSVKKLLLNPNFEKEDINIREDTLNIIQSVPPEFLVKRGPGRPRKYPRPAEKMEIISSSEMIESENIEMISCTISCPPPAQLKNFSFNEIEKDSCIILVKFGEEQEWLMLYDQFQQILSSFHPCPLNFNNLVLTPKPGDKQILKSLPKIGNLISSLQSRDDLKFIVKREAIQIIEKEFCLHLTGPFGYIDIPRILSNYPNNNPGNHPGNNLPLKLKLKLEKRSEISLSQSQSSFSNNLEISLKQFDEQKSPKSPNSFHM
jgi:ankyrin repeat protein